MKRNYVMMAMAAAMLASCAQTGLVEEIAEEPQKAIGFSTFVDKATRAENSGEDYEWDLEGHNTTFKVWGYKDVSTTKVFNGDVVSHNGSIWIYNPLRYWDKAATSYNFYAAAPAMNKGGEDINWIIYNNDEANQNDDYLALNNFELKGVNLSTNSYDGRLDSWKDSPSDIDLMIAAPNTVGRSAFTTSSFVNLQFNHILSRLNVTLYKASLLKDEEVVLKSIVVKGLKSKGSFNENASIAPDALGSGTTKRWSTESNSCDIVLEGDYTVKENNGTDKYYVIQSLVIPQTSTTESLDLNGTGTKSAPYFIITYNIGNEKFVAYYNLAAAFTSLETPTDIAFNEGWQNTLNITIQPSKIEFDAKLALWDDNETTDLLIK